MDYSTLVAGIGGAVIGVAGNKFISRPRVRIDIHDILLKINSSNSNDKKLKNFNFFQTPNYLIEMFNSCDHNIISPKTYYDTPLEYMDFLLKSKNDLIQKEFKYKQLPEILRQMEMLLNMDMPNEFLTHWTAYHSIFWTHLLLAYDSKKFLFDFSIGDYFKKMYTDNDSIKEAAATKADSIEETQNATSPNILTDILKPDILKKITQKIRLDSNNNYFIIVDSNKMLSFPLFNFDDTELKDFSFKIAFILLTKNINALKNIIKYLKEVNWTDPYFNVLKEKIESELNGFRKIIIKGMIVNKGVTPIALNSNGVLVIESKDFKYRPTQFSENVDIIKENISIPIQILDKNNYTSAVIINGGSALPFEACSNAYFRDMKKELSIQIDNLYNMEKKCFVKFLRLDLEKYKTSNKINFRDLNDEYL